MLLELVFVLTLSSDLCAVIPARPLSILHLLLLLIIDVLNSRPEKKAVTPLFMCRSSKSLFLLSRLLESQAITSWLIAYRDTCPHTDG